MITVIVNDRTRKVYVTFLNDLYHNLITPRKNLINTE